MTKIKRRRFYRYIYLVTGERSVKLPTTIRIAKYKFFVVAKSAIEAKFDVRRFFLKTYGFDTEKTATIYTNAEIYAPYLKGFFDFEMTQGKLGIILINNYSS